MTTVASATSTTVKIVPGQANFSGRSSMRNTCVFAASSSSPSSRSASRIESWNEWLRRAQVPLIFGRYRLVSCLAATLLASIVLNVTLAAWIIACLRLNQISGPLTHSTSAPHATIDIRGDLTVSGRLHANVIRSDDAYHHHNDNQQKLHHSKIKNEDDDDDNYDDDDTNLILESSQTGRIEMTHIDAMNGENSISLSDDGLEVKTTNLLISRDRDQSPLHITADRVSLRDDSARSLRVPAGGLRIAQQLNTTTLQADARYDFRIESRNEKLNIVSRRQIEIESIGRAVQFAAYRQVEFRASKSKQQHQQQRPKQKKASKSMPRLGEIYFDGHNLRMSHITPTMVQHYKPDRSHQLRHHKINKSAQHRAQNESSLSSPLAYQLCLCAADGSLYAVDADAWCGEASSVTCPI